MLSRAAYFAPPPPSRSRAAAAASARDAAPSAAARFLLFDIALSFRSTSIAGSSGNETCLDDIPPDRRVGPAVDGREEERPVPLMIGVGVGARGVRPSVPCVRAAASGACADAAGARPDREEFDVND